MSVSTLDGLVIVTGTDTDAGKTVVTAAIAARLRADGVDVALCKPTQTGLAPGEPGDVDVAARLSGVDPTHAHELVRLPEPLAPTTAARRAGVVPPTVAEMAARIDELSRRHGTLLVEGAGGVLVGLDGDGRTLLGLAEELRRLGHEPRFVVATRSVLGTLNHTQLTCDAVRARGFDVAGVVIGSWPVEPDLAEQCNLLEIEAAAGAPLLGRLPAGIGNCPEAVQAAAGDLT